MYLLKKTYNRCVLWQILSIKIIVFLSIIVLLSSEKFEIFCWCCCICCVCIVENLAPFGKATQSSQLSRGIPGNALNTPISNTFSFAQCSHTDNENPVVAWWMFRLSFGTAFITDVTIYYREKCKYTKIIQKYNNQLNIIKFLQVKLSKYWAQHGIIKQIYIERVIVFL